MSWKQRKKVRPVPRGDDEVRPVPRGPGIVTTVPKTGLANLYLGDGSREAEMW